MPVATLTLTQSDSVGAGTVFSFDTLKTDAGVMLDLAGVGVDEALTTGGVDGVRWRRRFRQYTPFAALGSMGLSSFEIARSTATKLRAASGDYATLVATIGGITRTLSVKILEANPQAYRAQYVAGDGIKSACVIVDLRLQIL